MQQIQLTMRCSDVVKYENVLCFTKSLWLHMFERYQEWWFMMKCRSALDDELKNPWRECRPSIYCIPLNHNRMVIAGFSLANQRFGLNAGRMILLNVFLDWLKLSLVKKCLTWDFFRRPYKTGFCSSSRSSFCLFVYLFGVFFRECSWSAAKGNRLILQKWNRSASCLVLQWNIDSSISEAQGGSRAKRKGTALGSGRLWLLWSEKINGLNPICLKTCSMAIGGRAEWFAVWNFACWLHFLSGSWKHFDERGDLATWCLRMIPKSHTLKWAQRSWLRRLRFPFPLGDHDAGSEIMRSECSTRTIHSIWNSLLLSGLCVFVLSSVSLFRRKGWRAHIRIFLNSFSL